MSVTITNTLTEFSYTNSL